MSGAGGKAFCAGGDVQMIREALSNETLSTCGYCVQHILFKGFFMNNCGGGTCWRFSSSRLLLRRIWGDVQTGNTAGKNRPTCERSHSCFQRAPTLYEAVAFAARLLSSEPLRWNYHGWRGWPFNSWPLSHRHGEDPLRSFGIHGLFFVHFCQILSCTCENVTLQLRGSDAAVSGGFGPIRHCGHWTCAFRWLRGYA